jgi:predicted CoA-binding protein
MKNTLVIGASPNAERYSHKAVLSLRQSGYPVIALGIKNGQIGDITIQKDRPENIEVDTVTLYLNPKAQQDWYSYILNLKPKRIIFNPGTENPELEALANIRGINAQQACTLVLLATNQY